VQKATGTSDLPLCHARTRQARICHPVFSALDKTLPTGTLTVTTLLRDRERHARMVEASFYFYFEPTYIPEYRSETRAGL
jgi:hypothetical protein